MFLRVAEIANAIAAGDLLFVFNFALDTDGVSPTSRALHGEVVVFTGRRITRSRRLSPGLILRAGDFADLDASLRNQSYIRVALQARVGDYDSKDSAASHIEKRKASTGSNLKGGFPS